MIGQRFNYEDVFFRDLTVCVLDTLEGEIKWVNKFSSGDRVVNVPFYYSLTGDERFLLDSFSDDIVSDSRYVDLNTDVIPRGHLTLTGYDIRSDEFANPNVWLKMVVEHNDEVRKVLTKVRAIPITAKYDLTILLTSEIDTFKCSQAIMDTLWLYRFMYFEHNFMNIDAVMLIPDTNQIEIGREKNMTSDNSIKLTVSFEVQTYYPAFRKPKFPESIPYTINTSFPNKTISVKVQISQGSCDNYIFTEFHTLTTDSSGDGIIQIGGGSQMSGNFLSIDTNSSGLKISVSVDQNGEDNFVSLVNCETFDTNAFRSDPNCSNLTWSNAFDYISNDGNFKDTIIYPKRTKWFNHLKRTGVSSTNSLTKIDNSDRLVNRQKIR